MAGPIGEAAEQRALDHVVEQVEDVVADGSDRDLMRTREDLINAHPQVVLHLHEDTNQRHQNAAIFIVFVVPVEVEDGQQMRGCVRSRWSVTPSKRLES